jgi:hypothetical protein
MKKLVKLLIVGALVISLVTEIGTHKVNASTVSQSSYKLTAYNSKGKKVNVNASKGLVVKKVSGKSWYKSSLKYTTYKKVKGKWKKVTKTTTVYIPSSKVKGSTKKTYKWVKQTKKAEAYFKADKQNQLNELKGIDMEIAKNSSFTLNPNNPYLAYVEDYSGKMVFAKTLDKTIISAFTYIYDDFDGDGNYDDFCSEDGWDKVCGDGKGDIDNDVDGDGIIDRTVWTGGKNNWSAYNDKDLDNDGIPNDVDDDNDNDGILNDIDKSRLVDFGKGNVSYIDYDHKLISSITTYKTTTKTQAYTKIYVAPKPGITLSRYNQIKLGMPYKQVIAITHDKGILIASYSGYRSTYWSYEFRQDRDPLQVAWIDFENGKVVSKAQANLH